MRFLFFILLMLGVLSKAFGDQDNLLPVAHPAAAISDKTVASGVDEPSVTFESLVQMNELIVLGLPGLALSLLNDEQQKRPPFTADWYAFEYKRIVLMAALEQWARLIERTQWLFEKANREEHITKKIRLWFETQQVIARLQLNQSEQALSQLQTMLWQVKSENRDKSLLAVWRRLVTRAYLQLKQNDDARRALVKYEADYVDEVMDIDWVLLQAQVLLETHRPRQAIRKLKRIQNDNINAIDVEALLSIAQLRDQPKQASLINQQMRKKLQANALTRAERWAYSYVAYLASTFLSNYSDQVLNLETMLSLGIDYPVLNDNHQVNADDLWVLYHKRGIAIANEHGLLFGNEKQWQTLSDKLITTNPNDALALNAALILQTKVLSMGQQHTAIVEILEKKRDGLALINQLYLHSSKVPEVNVLPDEVRYRLVDYALAKGVYLDAAKIMKSLDEPPQGNTLFDWRMRKARVLVLQGEYQQSEALIRKTLKQKTNISRAELDRYIQVVFDFQTVHQHQQAIYLFDLLSFDSLDEKLIREISFWKAESYFEMKKHDLAALYYLKSARAISEAYDDLWAQSARFKAGQALLLAEIYNDAEKVFSELLLVTVSDSRKALINQSLQKVRLLKSVLNQ
ncbi:MAG: hypothetical protein COB77_01990 [Gammaproteobacteria bacterium]|nr:MAG: hypothetical protein COB77_01990 [Gammaproteobacteria bacterium]